MERADRWPSLRSQAVCWREKCSSSGVMRCLSARIPIPRSRPLTRLVLDPPHSIYTVLSIIVAATLTISSTNSVLHGISWYLVGTGDHDHVLEINYASRKLLEIRTYNVFVRASQSSWLMTKEWIFVCYIRNSGVKLYLCARKLSQLSNDENFGTMFGNVYVHSVVSYNTIKMCEWMITMKIQV